MPPLILWALGVAGAAITGRWLYKESRRVNAKLHPEEAQRTEDRERGPKLERDPETGVYRPK